MWVMIAKLQSSSKKTPRDTTIYAHSLAENQIIIAISTRLKILPVLKVYCIFDKLGKIWWG
jgi:hypothetical protein